MLKQSPFYNFLNRRKNLQFAQYAQSRQLDVDYINWNDFLLPNDYADAEQEYRAIREHVALFDVTPMRKFEIHGAEAGVFLDHLVTRAVSTAEPMQGIYVALCNQDGSLKDDAILYKFSEDDYLLMPSDIDHRPHFKALCERLGITEIAFTECTMHYAGMAIQGPLSAAVVKQLGVPGLENLAPYRVLNIELNGTPVRIARMGFTADLGYECWMPMGFSKGFEQLLRAAIDELGIEAIGYGLTALEACRLEGGFIVAGWDCATELDPAPGFERSPYELGLGWLVDLDGCDFIGRAALLREKEQGGRYVKRCFYSECVIKLNDGAEVYADVDGLKVQIGTINCSSWSWGMSNTIGNASIIVNTKESNKLRSSLMER